MSDDLEIFYSEVLKSLPNEVGMQEFVISKNILQVPDEFPTTHNLRIDISEHVYGSLKVETLLFYAPKRTYRSLGLLIFAGMFSELTECTLHITHPDSDITSIKIMFDRPELKNVMPGFTEKPFAFSYWPDEIQTHPWQTIEMNDFEFPHFIINDGIDSYVKQGEGNVVEGFGNDRATALFADLLLNIGGDENSCERIELECGPYYK
ncbi:hypothetical protein MNBD_GAMMA12-925, partial [hydrothermal vent metagenome]